MNWMVSVLSYTAAFLFGCGLFMLVCAADDAAVQKKKALFWFGAFPASMGRKALLCTIGGVLAVLCAVFWGFSPATATRFLFLALLTTVAIIDMHTMEIPDGLCLTAAAIGLLSCFTVPGQSVLSRVLGVFCVSVPLLLIALLVPGAFGGGDIKLMAACGLLLGWKQSLLAALAAILLGGVWGVVLLLTKKKKGADHFAFGPFLCAGMAACTFFGDEATRIFMYMFDITRFLG